MADEPEAPPPTYTQEPAQRSTPPMLLPEKPGLAVALAKAEIDTAIATARAYPRAIGTTLNNMIFMATSNLSIAEDCIYSLPRGGKQIRGPSIRFAEIIRGCWGNSRDGAHEVYVDRLEGFVECEAFYHDLETNVATSTTVKRKIEKKRGRQTIDDDMTQLASAAAKSIARRNAILGGIPRAVWSQVEEAVEKVIRGDQKTLGERRDRAIAYFAKANISIEKLLKALNKPTADDIDLDDLVAMTGWRTAIQQGDSTLDEIFPEERKSGPKDLGEQLEALANDTLASSIPAEAGVGEAAGKPPSAAALPEGGSSNLPEGAAAAAPAAAVLPSEKQGAGKPAGGRQPAPAMAAPAGAKTPGSGPPMPAEMATAKRQALAAKGAEMATRGTDALMHWLDNLSGNDTALITPLMEKLWKEKADQSSTA